MSEKWILSLVSDITSSFSFLLLSPLKDDGELG